mmetsp:Transcript_4476/g.7642  ORF Transcript_4476/g.7642 Transcript_4476/m.7642 type:complete len:125 (+) Transcript_4476:1922-2296(+)
MVQSALSFNAVCLGHMLSVLIEEESQTIAIAFGLMQLIANGAGHIALKKQDWFFQGLNFLSPMSRSLELLMRGILHNNVAQGFILGVMKLSRGDAQCLGFLLLQGLFFLGLGWAVVVYKLKYKY